MTMQKTSNSLKEYVTYTVWVFTCIAVNHVHYLLW